MLTRPPRRAPDGPPFSRRGLLAAGVALIATTAGCTDLLEDGDDEPDADPVARTPPEATRLVHLDVDAIRSDGDTAGVLEELGTVDPNDVDDAVSRLETQTGLDPLEADALLFFGDDGDDGSDDSDIEWSGDEAVVDGDWSESDVVSSLESAADFEYESTTYRGESVLYAPVEETDASDAPHSLGVLGDGRFVVGSDAAVRSSLDVRYGDADPVSGPIREAYDDARGAQLTVASRPSGPLVPPTYQELLGLDLDILEEIEAVGRRYAAVDAGIALEVDLHVADERDAEELETTLRGALPVLGSLDAELDDARDDIVVEREGTVVEVAYEGDADAVFAVLDEV